MTDNAARIAMIACQALSVDMAAASQVEDAIRRELGGKRVQIAERPPLAQPPTVTLAQINEGLHARKPISVIAAEMGVHRATLYRHLKTKKSRPKPRV